MRSVPGIGRIGAEKFGATGGGSDGKTAGGMTPPGTGVAKGVAVGRGVGDGSCAAIQTDANNTTAAVETMVKTLEFRIAEFMY
jgi:hypothetical protein